MFIVKLSLTGTGEEDRAQMTTHRHRAAVFTSARANTSWNCFHEVDHCNGDGGHGVHIYGGHAAREIFLLKL